MNEVLSRIDSGLRWKGRWLAIAARTALLYPFLVLILLYSEWFLAWYFLGHPPLPSRDDPKFIDGSSWMHPLTFIAIMGVFPVGCAALALNILYALNARLRAIRCFLLLASFVIFWGGLIVWLRWSPHDIVEWWLD